MKHAIEYYTFLVFLTFIGILPQTWVPRFGRGIGFLCYYLGLRKSVALKNLSIAFGKELSLPEQKKLCKKVYANLGSVLFEFMLMYWIPPENLPQYIEFEGLEIMDKAMQEGKGAILAGGHFGHWELMSAGISTFSTQMNGYVGRQKNQSFDEILNRLRQKFGMVTISKSKASARVMIKTLKEKKLLGIIGDLNVPHDDLFVDFFGKAASLGRGLASFTVKYKCPLLFAWNVRIGVLKHKATIIRLPYELSGDEEQDIRNIAQMIISQLEKVIRENPDHYFWVNKRWKTRPPGEKSEPTYS